MPNTMPIPYYSILCYAMPSISYYAYYAYLQFRTIVWMSRDITTTCNFLKAK